MFQSILRRLKIFRIKITMASNMSDEELSSEVTKFAVKFLHEIHKGKNLVCSPLSVEYIMGLVALGASDPTQAELLSALGFKDEEAVRSVFTVMTSELMSPKEVTLRTATRLFVRQEPEAELDSRFQQDAVDVFDAAAEILDFDNTSATADHINTWVEKKTEDKITQLCQPDDINEATMLIAVNALYFKGNWRKPFPVKRTRDRPFKVNVERTINIPMMSFGYEENFPWDHCRELDAKILEMPYVGGDTSMVFVLPRAVDGLPKLLKTLAGGYDISKDLRELKKQRPSRIIVTLPKFKIETEIDLEKPLRDMGVNSVFSESKSRINKMLKSGRNLCVSKALQKAFIEVNEEGTEAAAATGCRMMLCSMPPTFCADHPFLYFLLGPKGVPLFVGVFYGE